ncbi:ABC transporter ATP-binding protein [Iodidimonas sp. SYSU 1G8]|uniref:ABC transporter ATP-binding protein n=1 Tax=Iodidimonas sp. SYSU 1G8 TaxID=3133967 RepID=UPI0031FEDA46
MTAPGTLSISHVSKRFQVEKSVFSALEGINLGVKPGEFLTLVGSSGCGKSTLLRLIAGLDTSYDGTILHDGVAVRGTSLSRGIVFQEHRLFPWLTVTDNIGLALENVPLSREEKRAAIAEHISLVGLEGFEYAYPYQLSGGMSQRVAIARGLVGRPEVLLLDEPFGALDALTRTRLQNELQRIWEQEGITMILVTHDVDEAVFLGDRVVVMSPRPGRIQSIVDVSLPRPRDRVSADFAALKARILTSLGDPV